MNDKIVCYILPAEDFKSLKVAAEWYVMKEQRVPPKLGEFKAEVFHTFLDRAVPVSDADARRMLPQFYGTSQVETLGYTGKPVLCYVHETQFGATPGKELRNDRPLVTSKVSEVQHMFSLSMQYELPSAELVAALDANRDELAERVAEAVLAFAHAKVGK